MWDDREEGDLEFMAQIKIKQINQTSAEDKNSKLKHHSRILLPARDYHVQQKSEGKGSSKLDEIESGVVQCIPWCLQGINAFLFGTGRFIKLVKMTNTPKRDCHATKYPLYKVTQKESGAFQESPR